MSNEDPDEEETPCVMKEIVDYRRIKINPIVENEEYTEEEKKEKLGKELIIIRSKYNTWNGFAKNFAVTSLVAFLTILFSSIKIENYVMYQQVLSILLIIFLFVAFFQFGMFKSVSIDYEKMKLVEAELEKINSAIQPNPKKISIRISNCNLVHRSIFGR